MLVIGHYITFYLLFQSYTPGYRERQFADGDGDGDADDDDDDDGDLPVVCVSFQTTSSVLFF